MKCEMDANEAVSTAVIRAVSAAENRSAQSLPPLYEAVDPDALDDLFSDQDGETPSRWGSTSFTFSASLVTINYNEYIEVNPLLESESSEEQREHSPLS